MTATITSANYLEPRWHDYLSHSQKKVWSECPARAYAWFVDRDERARQPIIKPFADGSLMDALLLDRDDLPRVEDEYRDFLFLKSGKPNAAYLETQRRAEWVKTNCPAVTSLIERSELQKVYTGQIAEVSYKAKLDIIDHDRRFIWDLKYMKSLTETVWSGSVGRRVDFIQAYDYIQQLATYRELVLQHTGIQYGVGILGVSKQDPPDVRLIYVPDHCEYMMEDAIRQVEADAMAIELMRQREVELARCETCDYCRTTRTAFVWEYEPK